MRGIGIMTFVFFIQGNECIHSPFMQQLVCSIVVTSGISTKTAELEIRIQFSRFCKRYDSGDAIVSGCLNYTQIQRKIAFQFVVIDGKNVLRIAIIPSLMIAIPAPPSIRVGKPARTVAVVYTIFNTVTYLFSVTASTGIHTGSITGDT